MQKKEHFIIWSNGLYFGFGLFSILLGTFLGGFLSEYYYLQEDVPELITALSAIAAIFVALLLLTWLCLIISRLIIRIVPPDVLRKIFLKQV